MSRPQESLSRAQDTIRQLYAELEQTNREVLALTLELEQQVDRLKLLNQITRAIDERQDLNSIMQVAVRSLEEHLPLDFGCACLLNATDSRMTVASVGRRGAELLGDLASLDDATLQIDTDGLATYLQGDLVCEGDVERNPRIFVRQLATVGLRALVVAPLRAEGKTLGALVAARRGIDSFAVDECEFIRQLSEHVGLAAHQAMLHGALEQAYEEMRRTQQAVMQQERLRALGQLAAGIAHDINNALSPASLYVQSMLERDKSLSGTARQYLAVVNRAIEDVGRTVGRMRMFYRPREAEFLLSSLDLNRLLREVAELTRVKWNDTSHERGIVVDLRTDLAANLPRVMGAENEIRDAFTNLVLNAVDAMPGGGTLALRSGPCGGGEAVLEACAEKRVFVEIQDTGVGMSEDTRNRCLEPFFTTKGERGTGLGLAMVYGMAQRHRAELEIDSAPGKGTVVRLTFPAAQESETREVVDLPRPLPALRILLVDDDPLLLKSLRNVLESEGHSVTTADGGQRGIDEFLAARARGDSFPVVITDLGMPNVNGRAVAAAIKAAAPDAAVILLTGWGQRLSEERELPEHVNRVLGKPPCLAELRSTLAELAGGL
jgi:signal transduction histidine kinase